MNSLSCIWVWFGCVYPYLDLLKLVCRLMPSSSWSWLKLRRLVTAVSLRWEMNHDENKGCWLLSTRIIGEYGQQLIAINCVGVALCINGSTLLLFTFKIVRWERAVCSILNCQKCWANTNVIVFELKGPIRHDQCDYTCWNCTYVKNNGTFGVYNSLKIPLTQAGWPYCALRQRSGCERVPCGGEEGGGNALTKILWAFCEREVMVLTK